jgi:hypothetical protein
MLFVSFQRGWALPIESLQVLEVPVLLLVVLLPLLLGTVLTAISGAQRRGLSAGVAGAIAAKGLPLAPVLLVAAMALMAVGSALVISGWKARLGAVLLLLFLVLDQGQHCQPYRQNHLQSHHFHQQFLDFHLYRHP